VAVLIALALAIKPLVIVLLLLAAALYPSLRLRLALCILLVLALPLIHPDPPAAWQIYRLGLDKVIASSMPGRWTWSDITDLLDQFGLQLSLLDRTILMNPRTEENTYIMLAVAVALFAVIRSRREGGSRRAWLLAGFCVALGCHAYGNWIFRPTELWLKPLICLAFLPILLEASLGRPLDRGNLSAEPAVAPVPTELDRREALVERRGVEPGITSGVISTWAGSPSRTG